MKLLFLGDFYYDYDYITDDILKISEYIKKNKLSTVLNLEGTLKTNEKIIKGSHLVLSSKYIEVLKLLNVKAVCLANNHVFDYGKLGFKELIKQLEKNNISFFGANTNLKNAIKPYIFNCDDKTISLGAFGWNMEECIYAKKNKAGTAPLDFKLINKIIKETPCDIFIPIFHFGYEYEKLPQPYHLKKCREILNNEKTPLIIGHHPHVVQAYEKNIYYSLGNFYFGKMRKNFYNLKDYGNKTSFGLGIIFNTGNNVIEHIGFVFDGTETKIIEKNIKLVDISKVNNDEYYNYFINNNNIINKKYVYKTGLINELIFNKMKYIYRQTNKIYLRKIKWPLVKKIKNLLLKKDNILMIISKVSPTLSTKILYKRRIGKKINLKNPKNFNEKIQWLKLNVYPKNDIYTICADKFLVRDYVKKCGCEEILNELYGVWDEANQIDWNKLPNKFVLKWNFGCGHNFICHNKSDFNESEIKKMLNTWKKNNFYLKSSELHYRKINKKIICEKNLSIEKDKMIDDYKFYCFNNQVYCVMICIGREKGKPNFYFMDKDWKLLKINQDGINIKGKHKISKPKNIEKMFEYAEKLCKGFPFVRVDLYNIDGKIVFGELTFTPSAGLDTGYTEEGNVLLGEKLIIERTDYENSWFYKK